MWKHLSRANCLPFALISFQLRKLEMVAHHYCRSLFTVHDLSPTVSRRRLFICSFCLADKCCTQILQTFLLQSIPIQSLSHNKKKKMIIITNIKNITTVCVCVLKVVSRILSLSSLCVCVYFAFVFGSSGWLRIAFPLINNEVGAVSFFYTLR